MKPPVFLFIAAMLLCSGCGLFTDSRGPESRAGHRMHAADSLEAEGLFQAAATQYAYVADRFPESSYYPAAVRRAALMYSIAPYSQANDSAAYRWYLRYLALPLSKPERENVRVSVELLHRILLLHAQIGQLYASADSLTVLARRQSAALGTGSRRMQDLEIQLQNAQAELKKIKEIDIRLSKSMNR